MKRIGLWMLGLCLVWTMSARAELVHSGFNGATGFVSTFASDADGDVPPLRRIAGAATQITFSSSPAVDVVHNELFVAHSNPSKVLVFDLQGTGNIAPKRILEGPASGLSLPIAVAVDTRHDEIYVLGASGPNQVRVCTRAANGNVAPLRTIAGANTGQPMQWLVYDAGRDELIVDSNTQYRAFPRTASGNVTPLRPVGGASAGIDGVGGMAYSPDPLFEDGFESGNTSAWSLTVP